MSAGALNHTSNRTVQLQALFLQRDAFAVQLVTGFVEDKGEYAAKDDAHSRSLVQEEQGYAGDKDAAGDEKVFFRMDLLEFVFHFF